ncbi:methyltransferase domain-containing protein [Russula dissimulans]|nr:methyltransferase domain-containing protein [Russula dissimulans]
MSPRLFLTIVIAFLLITVVLLLRPLSLPHQPSTPLFGRHLSLSAWLREEDERYGLTLHDRQQLVQKYGPTPARIDPYPTHNEMYTIWDFFLPAFPCPGRVERIGVMGDGGKWVCGLERLAKQDKCVIYSFANPPMSCKLIMIGINGESSFEADLLKRVPGCEAWGYDYSVSSWGPEITDLPGISLRAHFEPWALGGTDNHGENDNPKFWTLDSLMRHNGHTFIDILKIDIEGGEYDALKSFITAHPDGALPIGQLQIEIHARDGRERFDAFLQWWESLEGAGLRPFWTEPNLVYINLVRGVRPDLAEYSFINIRGDHALVNDAFN